jgi:hypothetical protein
MLVDGVHMLTAAATRCSGPSVTPTAARRGSPSGCSPSRPRRGAACRLGRRSAAAAAAA